MLRRNVDRSFPLHVKCDTRKGVEMHDVCAVTATADKTSTNFCCLMGKGKERGAREHELNTLGLLNVFGQELVKEDISL